MRIICAQPLDHFRVSLQYDNGVSGTVDLSHLAGRGVFEAWLRPGVFDAMTISSMGALEWPGELDLCPDALYLQMTNQSPEELFPNLLSVVSHA